MKGKQIIASAEQLSERHNQCDGVKYMTHDNTFISWNKVNNQAPKLKVDTRRHTSLHISPVRFDSAVPLQKHMKRR